MKATRTVRLLRGALLLIFGSLFAVSFWESWARLALAARHAKVPHPGPWPWSVDGFILVLVLLVVLALLEGRKPHLPRVGVVVMTGISAAISILYTPEDATGRWHAAFLVSALPAVAAWLSFEGIMWLLFGHGPATPEAKALVDDLVDERDADEALDREAEPSQDATPGETLTPVPDVAAASQIPAAKRRMIDHRAAKQMGGKTIAKEVGVSERLVYAYLRERRQPVDAAVASNGGVAR